MYLYTSNSFERAYSVLSHISLTYILCVRCVQEIMHSNQILFLHLWKIFTITLVSEGNLNLSNSFVLQFKG